MCCLLLCSVFADEKSTFVGVMCCVLAVSTPFSLLSATFVGFLTWDSVEFVLVSVSVSVSVSVALGDSCAIHRFASGFKELDKLFGSFGQNVKPLGLDLFSEIVWGSTMYHAHENCIWQFLSVVEVGWIERQVVFSWCSLTSYWRQDMSEGFLAWLLR